VGGRGVPAYQPLVRGRIAGQDARDQRTVVRRAVAARVLRQRRSRGDGSQSGYTTAGAGVPDSAEGSANCRLGPEADREDAPMAAEELILGGTTPASGPGTPGRHRVARPCCTRLAGVRLLRRRSDPPATGAAAGTGRNGATAAAGSEEPAGGADSADPRRTPGKGKPTPRRREAQRRRSGPVAPPPKTRREAYRRMREQGSDRRSEMRDALRTGDERYLPPRDQGPERRLVRNMVDARRNAGPLFLFVAVLYFAGLVIPDVRVKAFISALWLTAVLLVIVDSVVLGVRIRRTVRARFPDTRQSMRGLVFYGVTRATMVRRWRAPKPQVSVGDRV
jgi:Protein of unknown function (DUF3043)